MRKRKEPRASEAHRVRRAWHKTYEVQVLVPGFRRAEGREEDKGIIASWGLEEVQSKSAGRRTGTGYEVWDPRDERAHDREVVLHLRSGRALCESGVYVRKAPCPAPGGLYGVRVVDRVCVG